MGTEQRNPFVHVELVSTDVAKVKSFYGKLFKWKLEDVDMGDMIYTLIKAGDGTGGGALSRIRCPAGIVWIAYVKVGDVKAATRKAKSLGAKVKKDVTKVKGAGSSSIITDPTGAIFSASGNPRGKRRSLDAGGRRAAQRACLFEGFKARTPQSPVPGALLPLIDWGTDQEVLHT